MKNLNKLPLKSTKTLYSFKNEAGKSFGRKPTDPTNTFTLTTTHVFVK